MLLKFFISFSFLFILRKKSVFTVFQLKISPFKHSLNEQKDKYSSEFSNHPKTPVFQRVNSLLPKHPKTNDPNFIYQTPQFQQADILMQPFLNSLYKIMEESKRKEIREYLETQVNPVIRPLVEEIVRKRPSNIPSFINEYSFKLMNHKNETGLHSDSEEESEEAQAAFLRKIEEKKKKKLEKKNSRQGISAEVFGQFNQKGAFQAKVIPKSAQTKQEIRTLIEKSILFSNLNKDDLNIVIDAMQEVETQADQDVIIQGQVGDTLYIIDEGDFDCYKVLSGKQTYLKTYHPGEFFGELALMYNAPRAASIKSKGIGKLFGLDRATFNHIVQQAATKKRKYFSNILSKVEILAQIDPYEKEQLCDTLKQEQYEAGSYIVQQGDQGDRFYIIAEGKLVAEKKQTPTSEPKKVFEYHEGDYFGEIALVKNTVRQASIKAQTDCRVVYIQRDAFKRLLGPMEDILQRNMDKYKKYLIQ